ncbi:MAG: PAS domain S-box protein [Methanospirillum sp.]|nr:PAS domain S-box protein [Methanospirillum sp.]
MPVPTHVLAAIRQPALLYGPDGRIAAANDLAEALAGRPLAGCSPAEVVEIFSVRTPAGAPLQPADLPAAAALSGGAVIERPLAITATGGRRLEILATASPVREGDTVAGALAVWQDVTERERAGRDLRESEAKYRALIETNVDFIWEIDTGWRFTYCSPQIERLWGIRPGEMVGRTPFDLLPSGMRESTASTFAEIAADGRPFFGLEMGSTDGRGRPVALELSGVPFFSGDGALLGYRGVTRDVTGRKETEEALAALMAELEERVKARTAELATANRDLEAFSHHVSHDLRAPLRVIDGYLGLLLARFGPELDPDAVVLVGKARAGAVRAGLFLESLLSLAYNSHRFLEAEVVEPGPIVRDVLQELMPVDGDRRIEVTIDPLPPCRGDPEMLRHVWLNLLSNAVKFTRGRDPARIEVGGGGENEIVYSVRDNGVGFPSEEVSRVFDNFARFHNACEYEGSGIGLPLVRRIVERHGGRCWAESTPGVGSTFFFTLPAA